MWGEPAPTEQASPHFGCHELACRHCNRIVSVSQAHSLAEFLEIVRHRFAVKFGKELVFHIDSAHRCPAHNAAIGGAPHSYHPLGMAADVTVRGLTPEQVWEYCKELQAEGVIGGLGHYPSFTHIDYGPKRNWEGS